MGLADITRAGTTQAIAEHDLLGRDRFLQKYGFAPSRKFLIEHESRLYDSKAIVGVAHRFDRPELGPLDSTAFSGGLGHAVEVCRRLGFVVVGEMPKFQIIDDMGEAVGSSCEVNADGDAWAVTLHSRGGTKGTSFERNPGYAGGLRLVLRRLAKLEATVVEVLLDSAPMASMDVARRQLLDKVPFRLRVGVDTESIASAVMTAAARATPKGVRASGGNPTKQVRIRFKVDLIDDLEPLILVLVSRPIGKAAIDARPGDEATTGLTEGALVRTTVNRYERDPNARKACIVHYGAICQVCEFDFGQMYGPIGAGYIHVHHRTPIASIKESYEVDPVIDLVPLCPNCHAMIHTGRTVPLTVDELRQNIERQKVLASRHIELLANALGTSGLQDVTEETDAASTVMAAGWALRLSRTAQAASSLYSNGFADAGAPLRRLCIELAASIRWIANAPDLGPVLLAIESEHQRQRGNLVESISKVDSWASSELAADASSTLIEELAVEKGSDAAAALGQFKNFEQLLGSIDKPEWYVYYRTESADSHANYQLASPYIRCSAGPESGFAVIPDPDDLVEIPVTSTAMFLAEGLVALDDLYPLAPALRGALDLAAEDLGWGPIDWD